MSFWRRPEVWCAVAMTVCVALPWVTVGALAIPGYRLPGVATAFANASGGAWTPTLAAAHIPYAIPVLSAAVIVAAAADRAVALVGALAGAIPLAALTFLVVESAGRQLDGAGIGTYATAAAALLLVLFATHALRLGRAAEPRFTQSHVAALVTAAIIIAGGAVVGVTEHNRRLDQEARWFGR